MTEKKSSSKKAKAKDEPQATASASVAEKKDPPPKEVKEEPKVEVAKAPPAPMPVRGNPVVSFERWFAAQSKLRRWKPHWMAGMRAYADTSGRKSMDDWDQTFKAY